MSIFFLALSHILYLFTKCAPQFVRFPHNFLCHLQKSPGSIALFDVLSHFQHRYKLRQEQKFPLIVPRRRVKLGSENLLGIFNGNQSE